MQNSPAPVLPEHEPLRVRPLHRICLADFKVNPKFADTGYAYTETIRGRDQRRCLPGCTRPECCGKLRAFVAGGGMPSVQKKRGLLQSSQSSSSDTEEEDTRILKEYLGSGYARVMREADAEKREKLIFEAKAKLFADKHGKHRQAFERGQTPPGFWRTEMPTTQEDDEDREEARRMERNKVEERWQEALKGDGRWIFRDE